MVMADVTIQGLHLIPFPADKFGHRYKKIVKYEGELYAAVAFKQTANRHHSHYVVR